MFVSTFLSMILLPGYFLNYLPIFLLLDNILQTILSTPLIDHTQSFELNSKERKITRSLKSSLQCEWMNERMNVFSKNIDFSLWGINHATLTHSSEKTGLRPTYWPRKMLQNLLCLWKKKTQVVFFVFHLEQLWVLPLWMPWSMST